MAQTRSKYEVASAYVALIPKMQGVQEEIERAFAKVRGKAASEGKRSGGFFSSAFAGGIGGLVALGATKVLSGIKSQITEIVSSFSDLEDATGAAGVIFGKHMDIVQRQADNAAKTMGLTKAQVIDAANTFGTFGKAAGLTGKDLADFSTQMTQLASDLSSFKGGSPEEAIQAIGAAMRGEAEPIRRYGVLLDDATLKARALKLGLISSTKDALSPANKTLAAQAEILAQTKDAMGDFERTQFSTANTAKAFDATMVNFKTTLGGLVAPAFSIVKSASTGVLDNFSLGLDNIAPKVDAFWKKMRVGVEIFKTGDFTGAMFEEFGFDEDSAVVDKAFKIRAAFQEMQKSLGPVLATVKNNLGSLFTTFAGVFSQLAPVFAELAPGVLQVVSAFNPLSALFHALMPVLPTIAQAFVNVATALAQGIGPVLPVITNIMGQLSNVLSQSLVAVLPTISQLLLQLANQFGKLVSGLMPALQQLMPIIVKIFYFAMQMVQALLPALSPLLEAVITAVDALLPVIMQILPPLIEIVGIMVDALAPILPVIGDLVTIIAVAFSEAVTAVAPFITTLAEMLIPVLESLRPVVENVFSFIKDFITAAIQTVRGVIEFVLNILQGNWAGAWESMKTSLSGALSAITTLIKGIPSMIVSSLGNLGSLLWDAGKNVIQGFLNGISSMFNTVKDKLKTFTSWLPDWKGPAPVDAKILYNSGRLVMGGFQRGLEDSYGGIKTSLNGFTNTLNPVLPNSLNRSPYSAQPALAVYVQNPFTGEYLLSEVDSRTDGKLAGASRLRLREYAGI